ncbi:MAG: hypothetical protein ABJC04_10090 [Verrucomicrobiota bacterium]
MNDWNLQSRAHSCQSCQKHFTDKQPYHTLLFDEKNELRRLDICESCWNEQFAHGATDKKNVISRWHGVYEAPPATPPEAIGKENAETLLRKLIERGDPKHGAVCYILAVMLERKRLLKIKEQFKREGRRIFIYEQPKTGDVFTITDPGLQLNQLDEVQRDVAHLLEHGLDSPVANSAPESHPVIPSAGKTLEDISQTISE